MRIKKNLFHNNHPSFPYTLKPSLNLSRAALGIKEITEKRLPLTKQAVIKLSRYCVSNGRGGCDESCLTALASKLLSMVRKDMWELLASFKANEFHALPPAVQNTISFVYLYHNERLRPFLS